MKLHKKLLNYLVILVITIGFIHNASAKEKNPSFLVLVGKQQEDKPEYFGHSRGTAKPNRILKEKL